MGKSLVTTKPTAWVEGSLSDDAVEKEVYKYSSLQEILDDSIKSGREFWEYVEEAEGKDIWKFLEEIWEVMQQSVQNGLENRGVLPGELGLNRKAKSYFIKSKKLTADLSTEGLLMAYAHAVSEENASGGEIVTSPTCGACGVVPAVLYHFHKSKEASKTDILHALATAGLVGNIVKQNGSISGAMVGCQGEVGTACAMAAAAAAQLLGGSPRQIEYAAEMGLEHHLGLTCDPVLGIGTNSMYRKKCTCSCKSFALC